MNAGYDVEGIVDRLYQKRCEELERHLRACVNGWYNSECGDECAEDFERAQAYLDSLRQPNDG